MKLYNPCSNEAVELGCTCHVSSENVETIFWIGTECPLHCPTPKKINLPAIYHHVTPREYLQIVINHPDEHRGGPNCDDDICNGYFFEKCDFGEPFELHQIYDDPGSVKTLRCKKCGSTQFTVGQGSRYTAIRCETCKIEECIHDG